MVSAILLILCLHVINLPNRVQGVVGLVFGNENSASSKDSYVERLLDRISNGVLAEDRRTAIAELQFVVAESHAAQLAFGAMGFPVLLSVLKEERDDVEMVCGALETLVSALTPIDQAKALKNEVQPTLMNTDLLSREAKSISLLLSLLSEEDFYIRYYTLPLLTVLTNSPNRLQEAILTIPHGITRLMDMLMDHEVQFKFKELSGAIGGTVEDLQELSGFSNSSPKQNVQFSDKVLDERKHAIKISDEKVALAVPAYELVDAQVQQLDQYLKKFDEELQRERESAATTGSAAQNLKNNDCLELLNNLIRNNASNQVLLRETMGFDPLISILKLRGSSYSFTQQKTINLLNALETIGLLIMGGPEIDTGKDVNRLTNKAVLVQKKVFDHLLMLGVESQWAPVPVRCTALRCIGASHTKNLDALASRVLGEEPQKNPDGQAMLASTLIPQPQPTTHALPEEDVNMSFGSMLLHGLTLSQNDGDLETCSRAASVLSHVLKDNMQCKERVLRIELEEPTLSLGAPEPLLHHVVKYLALASCMKSKEGKLNASGNTYVQAIILKLLVIWHSDCPSVVQCFLDSRPHLTYLLELVSNSTTTVCIRGLAAVILGECVIYNKSSDSGKDAFTIVDAISQKVGLTSYFLKFEEMQKSIIFSSAKPADPGNH
ncbi:hypothetical protein ACSBR2_041258 [Camellia fascicularis]